MKIMKVAEQAKAYIRKHIGSFPHVPSHFCRQEIRRNYLSQELNIRRLYRLYVESCSKGKIVPEKECIHRNIFCDEYNLGFFQPKRINATCVQNSVRVMKMKGLK